MSSLMKIGSFYSSILLAASFDIDADLLFCFTLASEFDDSLESTALLSSFETEMAKPLSVVYFFA